MTLEDFEALARAIATNANLDSYGRFLLGQDIGKAMLARHPDVMHLNDFVRLAQGIEQAECGGPPL